MSWEGGLPKWAEETLRKEGMVVRSRGRGMLLHSSKKGCFEPSDLPSTELSPCRQRAAQEARLRICALVSLRKSPSCTALPICLALAASQLAVPAQTCRCHSGPGLNAPVASVRQARRWAVSISTFDPTSFPSAWPTVLLTPQVVRTSSKS